MKIQLFGNFRGDRQWSMIYYGRALKQALRRVAREGDAVHLVVPPGKGHPSDRWKTYWKRYAVYPVLTWMGRHRADIHHIVDHGYGYLINVLPVERTLITCHDLIVPRLRLGLIPGMSRRPLTNVIFERQIQGLRRAAHVIAVSQQTRTDLMELLQIPPERISVVYPGLSPLYAPLSGEERQALRRQWGWDDGRSVLLHVGGSALYKNTPVILKAMALLRSQALDVHWVKVGFAWSQAEQTLIRDLQLEKVVHLTGHASRHRLRKLYSAADVFVFPSLWEGFGWPPLEAMACRTPVVASDRGALRETLDKCALIVNPEDPKKVAEGVRRLLEDAELRRTLQERGDEQTMQFSWERAAEKIWALYEKVADRSRPTHRMAPRTEKVKVLLIGAKAEVGGAYTSLLELVRKLDHRYFEIHVILPLRGALHQEYEQAADHVSVFPYTVLRSPRSIIELFELGGGFLKSFFSFRRFVRETQPDVVFVSSVVNPGALIGSRLAGVPVICHKLEIIQSWKSVAFLLDLVALVCAKRVVCISEAVARSVPRIRWMSPKRVRVIYNAIDCDRFNGAHDGSPFRQEFNLKSGEIVVGLIARLVPWKGQQVLLEAVSLLKDVLPYLRVFIVGSPVSKDSERYAEDLVRYVQQKDLGNHVIFTGTRKDLENVIAGLDILVSLSTDPEPFGETIVQAMAMKKPVIACNCGGPAEIVLDGVCGYLIPPKDPATLARVLQQLVQRRAEWPSMGEKGRERAVAVFDSRREAQEITSIIAGMLQTSQRHGEVIA